MIFSASSAMTWVLLKADRTNTYLAFNFFVTAEHMKDWLYLHARSL